MHQEKKGDGKGTGSDQPSLPPLSLADFKVYNALAERIDEHHNHFRTTWTTIYSACAMNCLPESLTTKQFCNLGIQLCEYLNMHHSIEEEHVFPVLAKRMPAFAPSVELVRQHREIHAGLERLEGYLRGVEKEIDFEELKGIMDGFGKVLWEHLDDEVRELGAENMRWFYTVEEMGKFPF